MNTTNLLLQTLACVDTVYLVTCLFIQTAKTLVDATDWPPAVLVNYVPRLEPYIWPAASCAQTATVWTVLLLTADRYAAVCHPFDARLRSLRRSRRRSGNYSICDENATEKVFEGGAGENEDRTGWL